MADNVVQQNNDIKELEESLVNSDGFLNLSTEKVFDIVESGFILVRKNRLTRKFSISGLSRKKLFEKKIKVVKKEEKKIVDLTDDELDEQIAKAKSKLNDDSLSAANKKKLKDLVAMLNQEKKHRSTPSYNRHPKVLIARVVVEKTKEVSVPRVNAELSDKFTGPKFRWFWHSTIKVPLRENALDTRKIKVDVGGANNRGEEVEIDVDYHFRIVDPVKFMNHLSGEGKNPVRPLLNRIGDELDQAARAYVTEHGVDDINTPNDSFDEKMQPCFDRIIETYGLVFYPVKKVVTKDKEHLEADKKIALSRKKIKVAENEAAAQKIADAVEVEKASALKAIDSQVASLEIREIYNALKQNNPNLSEEKLLQLVNDMLSARNLTSRVNIGNIGSTPTTPVEQPIEPQRQVVNTYTDEQIQELVNLGVCYPGGYLSVEDSQALCAARGIPFNGVLFNISALNFFEVQQLVDSKKNQNPNHK